ncbi:hypothetical protein C8R47DRAFT_1071069 [Mycena vitilis]|nr:hypothetical protein C8R47DRAFT_1071069 [Mycena vitilis]
MQNFRERTDLTKVIKSILDSYPLGNGILRELLQNSDDASATQQTFILDMRTHPSESVVDPDLVPCQGPALLAINDTLFSDSDWTAISTLHSSSKTTDETKVGKFGIGARACYHITDNPHFLSGRKLVIFDPHERFSGVLQGGVMVDITEWHAYPDQFAAFAKSLAPDDTGVYPGTVVRLPLRTVEQASKSTIKPSVVEPSVIETLFKDFVEKELSVVMLFLKHIRYICLKVIHPDGRERFIGSAEIPDLSIAEKRVFSRNTGARQETFKCAIHVTSSNKAIVKQVWRICHAVRSTKETSRTISGQLGYTVGSKLADDKLFSHVALAFPVNDSTVNFKGRLFTLLPLPIYPQGFPVHMHAILALTQDRQSLRNPAETGTGRDSRERLLVTWNRAIFDEFLPPTWAALLRVLVEEREVRDIWSAWPAFDNAAINGSDYWDGILSNLLSCVLDLDLPIFPTFPNGESHVALSAALVASETDDVAILRALANVGLAIVKLPPRLLKVIPSNAIGRLLHPSRVRDALRLCIPKLEVATKAEKDHILRYLAIPPGGAITHVIGLPLVPLVDGTRVSLSRSQKYVLVTQQEGAVFGDSDCNGVLISLSHMPADVGTVFCASTMLDICRLNKTHVREYLNIVFGGFNPALDEVSGGTTASKIEWLAPFWKWMYESTWEDKNGLLSLAKNFHILATANGTLRKMESRILRRITGPKGDRTMKAWNILGVHFIHPSMAQYDPAFSQFAIAPSDIVFLISSVVSSTISGLDSDSALLIQDHLVQSLGSRSPPRLDPQNLQKLIQLPIFPIRIPIPNPKSGKNLSRRVVGTASGSLLYLRVDDSCPVPQITHSTFCDVGSKSGILGTLIDSAIMRKALDELGVLEMSVDHLAAQPTPVLDALLSRIIHRLSDLSPLAKTKLQHVPFVSVVGSTERVAPSHVIDPRSELASLYKDEPGKLPSGEWARDPHLSLLTSHGFFRREVTVDIVTERITFLGCLWSRDEYARIFSKAQIFLGLLDRSWPSIRHVSGIASSLQCHKPWMPVRQDTALAAPVSCRDKGDPAFLFDLVLSVVNGRVYNAALRGSLGWAAIPMHILQDQLSRALAHAENRPLRLHALIKEFSRHSQNLSEADIDGLKRTVANQPWIPIRDPPPEIVETRHALLRAESSLRGRFKTVPRSLLDGQGSIFLQQMGCTASPSLETLLTELESLLEHQDRPLQVCKEAMEILKEIAPLLPAGRSQDDYERILVPARDGILHPVSQVYFVDCASDYCPEGFPVHSAVSESLARELEVQFLSSLELDEDEDEEDDLQMGEDFTKRVEGVLKEHDMQHALNEFMANAIDANASEFSVTLDERTFESSKVLGPRLAELQRRPSLFLYNDATFSESDFRGLRQVGQGGKRSNPDSIGRYGLGALSLFHFTDVVQIVSNQHLLILDPSGTHLPPVRGRPRTSSLKRIVDVVSPGTNRRYPDQLSAFDSVRGFSRYNSSYSGTLFRLPLREKSSVLSSTVLKMSDCLNLFNGPYFGFARDAMYFTHLEHISAAQQPPMGPQSLLWRVDAIRTERHNDHEIVSITASTGSRDSPMSTQHWLVTKSTTPVSSIPFKFNHVLVGMGLHESKVGLVVRMGILLEATSADRKTQLTSVPHFLFSTLRLPIQTSLSAHISAPFAISSDRRHIRFEPPDLAGNRIPQAEFNNWILDTLVPPLYVLTIGYTATVRIRPGRAPRNPFPWWPVNDKDSDTISRVIVQAFYTSVQHSSEPICYTVTGELIAPIGAVFPASLTPFRVRDVLRTLGAPNFAEPPYEIEKCLAHGTEELHFVDSSFVRGVLQSRTVSFITLFSKRQISVATIDAVLAFLLKGRMPVSDLPLLVGADGTLTCINSQPIKYLCNGDIPEIFPRNRFLHEGMEEETRRLLMQTANINVRLFDSSGVLALVNERVSTQPRCTHPPEIQRWIAKFWETYSHLPGPPTPNALDQLPLISTASGEYISLEYCRTRDDVITEPDGRPALVSAMQKMALVFCRVPEPLRASFDKPFNLQSFLKAIRSRSHPFESLSSDETREIGSWIRLNVYTCADPTSRNVINSLPIWEARQNGRPVLIDAHHLEMLPDNYGLSAEIFDGYTKSDAAIANFNHGLQTVLSWIHGKSAITSEGLVQLLIFSTFLDVSTVGRYLAVLRAILNLGGTGMVPVPDGNLQLRPVSDLYDHSVELFEAALHSQERTHFLHPDFRHMHGDLRTKGLHFKVDWQSFYLCADTIDDDLRIRGMTETEIMPRAEVVYNFYNSSLPRIVMINATRWGQLNGLHFIPRHEIRSPSSSYFTDSYCDPLPRIVAPSQILRRKDECVAWTQRALCQEEPTGDLLALNESLGIPTVIEVVRHLHILAVKVAPEHPGNRTLLQQIRETYAWLNRNEVGARNYLLQHTNEALFLNVDDPDFESWEWRTAEELLFDVQYDWTELGTFRVRQFLQNYRPLLLAAGAGIEHAVDYQPKTKVQDGNTLRDAFDAMRKAGKLTDVVLMPMVTSEDMDVETLRAHSTFLAAAIPHVGDGLLDWAEGRSTDYSFPGTYFGALAILEFVYTGKIELHPGETDEGHMAALRDLLELLGSADEWDMPELKDEIGRLINDWRFLSRDTYRMILKEAKKYRAASLLEYCQEWGRKNPKSVRSNTEDEENSGSE